MMTPLDAILRERMERVGPITVAEFMTTALQHPEHGYYRTAQPIGAAGDFTTAPEISQMFGEMIGLWCAATWRQLGSPDPFALVELGPGRGTLMADALRAARIMPAFQAASRLHLVESNSTLRARQNAALAEAHPSWHDTLGTVPEMPLIVIANEFFDALAIHQVERIAHGLAERRVTFDPTKGGFTFVTGPLDPAALAALANDPRLQSDDSTVIEVCPEGLATCRAIAERIAQSGGVALIIDYGPAQSAAGDSLQAVSRHRRHPVLETPGKADITAHVDFAALARAARAAGAGTHGPLPQGLWLKHLGIDERARGLMAKATPPQAADIRSQLARLVEPDGMGTLFKVLAIGQRGRPPLAGFEMAPTPC